MPILPIAMFCARLSSVGVVLVVSVCFFTFLAPVALTSRREVDGVAVLVGLRVLVVRTLHVCCVYLALSIVFLRRRLLVGPAACWGFRPSWAAVRAPSFHCAS